MIIDYKGFIERKFKIVPKKGGTPVPFTLNVVQAKYYQFLIDKYGPELEGVRENVLKARQQGFSAFIDAMLTVDFLLKPNITTQIISHKKEETKTLINRVNFFLDSYLQGSGIDRKDILNTDSKEFLQNRVNGSELFIGTAGARTLGRGDTLQNIHWSEVGFYPNTEIMSAEKLVGGAEQQVGTGVGKIFRESTGNMQGDFWHQEIERSRMKESTFNFRFFAWFEDPSYRIPVENFDPTPEEIIMMQNYKLDTAQINWYRSKMSEFKTKSLGLREYPTIVEESFLAAGDSFFDPDTLKWYYDNRVNKEIREGGLAMDGQWV